MEERTEQESNKRKTEKNSRFVGAAKTSKEHAEWCRLQQKNVSILGLLKWKEWSSATERAVGKYVRATFAKRKRNRAIYPKQEIIWWESQGEREGDQSGSMERKGWTPQ